MGWDVGWCDVTDTHKQCGQVSSSVPLGKQSVVHMYTRFIDHISRPTRVPEKKRTNSNRTITEISG